MLRLRPISLRDANEYVRQHHRHHKPVAGHKFSIGCEADGELVGVIIAGRPVSRYLDDGFTLEVKMMLVLLYLHLLHYVKRCKRRSILPSHSLLESAHSFSSVSTSAFIGKFFL